MRSESGPDPTDIARAASSETQTVLLAPGRFYRRMWISPICMIGLALIIVATPEASSTNFVDAVVIACALVSASLLLPLYFRPVRTVVADSTGIRLLLGRRVRKDLPWDRISRIYVGPRHYRSGVLGVYDGFGLWAIGKNLADSINLVDTWFTVDANALLRFSETVERMAESRSTPVYTRTGRW